MATVKVKDLDDLFTRAEKDVVEVMDSLGFHLYNYVDLTVYQSYRKECNAFWPILDEKGEPIKNTDTGEEYTEHPRDLAHLLRGKVVRDGYKRDIKIWVDTQGLNNADALIRVGKLMEVHGPRPWSRLKAELSSPAKVKEAARKSVAQIRELVFGAS